MPSETTSAAGVYTVLTAVEVQGFAKLEREDDKSTATVDLYVVEDRKLVRLEVGDRVKVVVEKGKPSRFEGFVSRAGPPPESLEDTKRIFAELEAVGVRLPGTVEAWAERLWRRKQDSSLAEVRDECERQLPLFFRQGPKPFDDTKLAGRVADFMKKYLPDLTIVRVVEEGSRKLVGFDVEPGGRISLSDHDPANQKPCFAWLIEHLNGLLEEAGKPARWVESPENWALGDPALLAPLKKRGLF